MTALEMANEFKVKYNVLTNYEGQAFSNKEISLLLTQAQENVIEQYRSTSEAIEARKPVLAPLKVEHVIEGSGVVVSSYFSSDGTKELKSYSLEYPTDVLTKLHERVDLIIIGDVPCYNAGTIVYNAKVKTITEDYFNANSDNPFKKPYPDLAWKIVTGNSGEVILICDWYFKPYKYILHYYKMPDPIIVPSSYSTTGILTIRGKQLSTYSSTAGLDCILDVSIHSEIVQEAIRIATVATRDQLGVQLQQLEQQLSQARN